VKIKAKWSQKSKRKVNGVMNMVSFLDFCSYPMLAQYDFSKSPSSCLSLFMCYLGHPKAQTFSQCWDLSRRTLPWCGSNS
jgi:hypothetical protein